MDSMPMLDDDFNYNEINLDFLESPPVVKASVGTTSYQFNSNFESKTLQDNSENKVINNVHEEFYVDKNEIKDFDFDFLESLQKEKLKPNFLTHYKPQELSSTGITIKTESQSNANSSKTLAKRIADVDALVRRLQIAEAEKKALQKQMEDFNKSAQEIQLLYSKERSARIEAEAKNKALETQCDDMETQLASKSLEIDQVQAQLEDCSGPIHYSDLATHYLKLAQKLEEERKLHWHDQSLLKDIAKFCKDKGLKIPKIMPRSPSKRKTGVAPRKIDAEVQCDLATTRTTVTELEKARIQQRHQSTQCVRTETRSQGCQHIGSTTTRGTTTACFFKYHDVGTNCNPVDLEPAFKAILEEMRTFGDKFAPLSPIADFLDDYDETLPIEPILPLATLSEQAPMSPKDSLPRPTCSIGINTSSESSVEQNTVGCCTYICNVQRPLDFMPQPAVSIKRSYSRPPSTTGLPFERVKDELNSRSSNSSPINFNMNAINNQLPPMPATPSSSLILPNAFDELWQIFGQMLYGVLNRRLSNLTNAGSSTDVSAAAPHNITNQQDFYNWLHALYTNVQVSQTNNMHQNANQSVPLRSQREMGMFSNIGADASINRSMSCTSNENTPLSFSDAAPNAETVPNVMKPTALRNNLRDSNAAGEPNPSATIQIARKSIATSPIRCLNTTIKYNERFPNVLPSNKSLNNTFNVNDAAIESETAAFKITSVENNEKNGLLSRQKANKVLKTSSHRFKKHKGSKPMKIIAETGVDFLAKFCNTHSERECRILAQSQSVIQNHLKSKQKKQSGVKKLRQINNMLFGSESETDTEIKTSSSSSTVDSSSDAISEHEENTYSDSSCRSGETCLNKTLTSFEDGEKNSLQIIDDFLVEEVDINQSTKNNDEIESCKVYDAEEPQPHDVIDSRKKFESNEVALEIKMQDSPKQNIDAATKIVEQTFAHNDSTSSLDETSKRRGRKRKGEAVMPTTSTKISPCKRSARLLAKKVNQQFTESSLIKTKQPTILTFSENSVQMKKTSKTNCEETSFPSKEIEMTQIEKSEMASFIVNNEKITNPTKTAPYLLRKSQTLAQEENVSNSDCLSTSQCLNFNSKSLLEATKNISENCKTTSNLLKNSVSSPLLPKSESSVVPSKPFGLKNTNISTLFATPYALQRKLPLRSPEPATSTKAANSNSSMSLPSNLPSNDAEIQNSASTFSFYGSNHISTVDKTTMLTNTEKISPIIKTKLNFEVNSSTAVIVNKTVVDTMPNDFQKEYGILTTTTKPTKTEPMNCALKTSTSETSNENLQTKTVQSTVAVDEDGTPNDIIKFDSPPASPQPLEIEENETAAVKPKEIPLELSDTNFPTWRRRKRQHKKSLMHNLINAYDSKLYQGCNSNDLNGNEIKKVQQMVAYINECIRHIMEKEEDHIKVDVDLAFFDLNLKLQQISTEAKIISKAILISMQKQQRPATVAYEQYVNGAPTSATTSSTSSASIHHILTNHPPTFSTNVQRCCPYVLNALSSDVLTTLLQSIESTLFHIKNADSLLLYETLNLTDLYLLVLQRTLPSCSNEMMNPARLFIAKCLYYHKLKAAPMIYAVLCAFPTVLPHREERRYDRSDALITVIQHCLMCNVYDMSNSDLQQRELLSKLRFQYHFECFKPDFHEVLKNLIEKLRANKLENLKFAFAIFCKRLQPERVIREIIQPHFIPLANEYYRLVTHNEAYEARLATLLDCFSIVIKPFPRDSNAIISELPNYLIFFKRFLTLSERPLVQEAAIHAILRLQRFDFLHSYQALAQLRLEFELQPNTRAALKTYIYRKPLSFWKALMLQNS